MPSNVLETALKNFERMYGVQITIIDRSGYFHDHEGKNIFSRCRHSHRKNKVCDLQFDQRCIDHCRHEVNEIGMKKKKMFEHTCWKGVSELAVPMFLEGHHLGTFYVGQWQCQNTKKHPQKQGEFKRSFLQAFAGLPSRNQNTINCLKEIAGFWADALVLQVQAIKMSQSNSDSRQQQIIAFLQQRPGGELSLNCLAQHLALSSSRCSHVVKEHMNRSLNDLICEERIRRACQLLTSSDRSAYEIAEIIGISDQYYFNKLFKSIMGVPPGRYRKINT